MTIGQLKQYLSENLEERPHPTEQRLIYQGRPLLQDATPVKEALRLEDTVSAEPKTIHIIIQPRPSDSHPAVGHVPHAPAQANQVPGTTNAAQALPTGFHATTADDYLQDTLQSLRERQARFRQLAAGGNQTQQIQPPQIHVHQHWQQHLQHVHNAHLANAQAVHLPQPGAAHAPLSTDNVRPQEQQQPLHPLPPSVGQWHPPPNFPVHRPMSVPPQARPGEAAFNVNMPHGLPIGLPLPPLQPIAAQISPPSQPTVWLATSRNGPEGIVFAPGHGFFSSPNPGPFARSNHGPHLRRYQVNNQIITPISSTSQPTPNSTTARDNPPTAVEQPLAHRDGGAERPGAVRAPVAAAVRPRDRNVNLVDLVIERGWLFLRLYMFTFMISERNTWLRHIFTALALFYCLLPRENPLQQIFTAIRRHVDSLIGPPQPAARPGAAPAQTARANLAAAATPPGPAPTHNPASTRTTPLQITPEIAAARVLAERAAQDQARRDASPNMLRDIFYRLEQAIALFLASLIPGVGERHVAAREEQRRLALQAEVERLNAERERTEAEIRTREEEQARETKDGSGEGSSQQQQQQQPDTTSSGTSAGATSSGIAAAETQPGGQLRARNVDNS
jgi:hypothetical protein